MEVVGECTDAGQEHEEGKQTGDGGTGCGFHWWVSLCVPQSSVEQIMIGYKKGVRIVSCFIRNSGLRIA